MTVCSSDPIEDCGLGIRIERRYLDGTLDGIAWWHTCGESEREDYMSMQPAWPDGWTVEQAQPLTLTPSILCLACKLHGFIRGGKWVPA